MTEQQQTAVEKLGRLTEVGRSGGEPTEGCWYGIEGKPNAINLFQMGVTDADMKSFVDLPEFEMITIRENRISDKGFKHVAGQTKLKFLDMGETDVSRLTPLKNSTKLEILTCDLLSNLTDSGTAALESLHCLRFLNIGGNNIGDKTVQRLRQMQDLEVLELSHTRITDEGLRHLKECTKLKALGLSGTQISDGGLEELFGLSSLTHIGLGLTNVTPDGWKSMWAAIPGICISEFETLHPGRFGIEVKM